MLHWPAPGTRVTVRYRRPAGSIPPLTDAVGHLLQIAPTVRIATKTGAVVEFAPADAVLLRVLTDAPVRTAQIRALEHAAALACPGVEQHWLDGWFLRAGLGITLSANSAVPLGFSADTGAIPAIADWYLRRDLTPRLAVPDRLLALPGAAEHRHRVLVRNVTSTDLDPSVSLAPYPEDGWLRVYRREIAVAELTAVVDGELVFGSCAGMAVARAAVTDAPDGTRWVGLSALKVSDEQPAAAERLCEALLAWGALRGAVRGYLRVFDDDPTAGRLAESLRFAVHHGGRYVAAPTGS